MAIPANRSKTVAISVTSSAASGFYANAAVIPIVVKFSGRVSLAAASSLSLHLKHGSGGSLVPYTSGSGTDTLIFNYTVQSGQDTSAIDALSLVSLDSATALLDEAGRPVLYSLPASASAASLAAQKQIHIDTLAPAPASSIVFSSPLSATLAFGVSWTAGSDNNLRGYRSKICADSACSLSCTDESDVSLDLSATKTGVDGSSYYACVRTEDKAGNISAWIASATLVTVRTSAPTITSVSSTAADGYYKEGAVIPITLQFSENVYVVNGANIRLSLETGATDTEAVYASGAGSNTLVFNYTVAAGDNTADLDAIAPLSLGALASIQNAGGNNASLTLPIGGSSLAGQKALVIDTTLPSGPSALSFPASYSLNPSFLLSWTSGTDTNFHTNDGLLCTNPGCSAACISATTSLSSPASVTGLVGGIYYGCVQSRDLAGNVSGYVASASTIKVEALPSFAGVISGEVLGSWADGTGKLELTFGGTPAASLQKYQVFYSASATYASFDLSSPIATINYGDATYDASPGDTKLLVSIPAARLKDGYYYVRYFDVNGKYVDPNRSISSLVHVLKDTPGYVLVPKKFSMLSYDYYIMRYEASLSTAGTLGLDTVTSTEASLAACSYKFHVDGTAADGSCGTSNTTKAAVSVADVTPQASISWSSAFFSCRNASGPNAKVRLPTADEWRRASQWIGTSYTSMWTSYSNNTGGNCNVTAGSAGTTGSASLCKSALGAQDMAGNLSEWVDNRMLPYSISTNTESRFSYGPTIGRTLPNGIDNIVRRYHTVDPGAGGLAMTLGANFQTPAFAGQKQYGTDVQAWTDPTPGDSGIGFRCLGFRADTMPTMSQLALPDEAKFVNGDLATAGLIPENLYVKDNRWEQVAITIDGTSSDAVAEGRVNVSWQPWSKTSCDTSGSCTASDAGLIYKLYRFTEPNRQSIRTATPWALANGASNYTVDKPLDPLAVDSNGNRLFTGSTSNGTLIATISNCVTATPGNCSFADLSTKDGGSLLVGKIYNYILTVEDAAGNAVTPMIQRFRSPYFTGPALASASAFRMEPRLRRASVFLVDEYHQQNQTRPQIMVHVPMDKSGLDHDFFIQKYEASQVGATAPTNNSPAGASHWPLQGTAAAWVSNAALCLDVFLQTASFDLTGCGNGSAVNTSVATVQSKQGTNARATVDQGAAWKACRYTTVADSEGKNYSLQLAADSEWLKAADWGDTNHDGTIEASVNPFTEAELSILALEPGFIADSSTNRCHTDGTPGGFFTSSSSGAGSTSSCRSRYGAADMIGNIWEMTAGQVNTTGQDNGRDGLLLGQSFLTGGGSFASFGSGNYDLLRALPKGTSAAPVVFDTSDVYSYSNSLRVSIRGGSVDGTSAGRWALSLVDSPSDARWWVGFRCVF